MYRLHPSATLRDLFAEKPYQGAHPAKARFVFVGLDANDAADIESHPIFRQVVAYHADGPRFWRERSAHHPFLLKGYGRGAGRKYHDRFAEIGFGVEHADDVSFVELLHLPTVGVGKIEPRDLDAKHLVFLSESMRHGAASHVFVAPTVLRLVRKMRTFEWLDVPPPKLMTGPLHVVKTIGAKSIHRLYHLSNYGAHQKRIDADVLALSALVGKISRGSRP